MLNKDIKIVTNKEIKMMKKMENKRIFFLIKTWKCIIERKTRKISITVQGSIKTNRKPVGYEKGKTAFRRHKRQMQTKPK